jgi:glucose/arabinose dehydrogenase
MPLLPLLLASTTGLSAQTVVDDPVEPVRSSGVFVWIRDFAEIPHSSSSRPFARINQVEPFSKANGWLGVNDLNGPMYMVNYQGNPMEYVDLRDIFPDLVTSPGLGTGFTSFAAHPQFDQNGRFFTAHTESGNSAPATLPLPRPVNERLQGVIVEWTAADPTNPVFSGTRREILRVDLPGTIHGIQEIAFRPDIPADHPDYGLLFICIGDGQTLQMGPLANTGSIKSPLGTVLRIDPSGTNANAGQYGIPPDNPFVGTPDAVEEIWAYGFRNPHRIAWDNVKDRLLLTDIGERQIEELNVVEPGQHYGWPVREGPFLLDPDGNTDVVYELPQDDTGFTYPVAMYDHDEGFAIAGGFVYGSDRIPGLKDMFLASDIRSGKLFLVPADNLEPGTTSVFQRWYLRNASNIILDPFQMVGSSNRTDLRIGQDHFGQIYILTKQDGIVRKLVSEAEPASGYGLLEGFPWSASWIDARGFLGWAFVADYPWVWLPSLQKYAYAAPTQMPSGWLYLPKP